MPKHRDQSFFPIPRALSARWRARRGYAAAILALSAFFGAVPAGYAQTPAAPIAESPYSYADLADLVARSDAIAVARPRSLAKVKQAPIGQAPGTQRFYVDAQVDSLIRGESGLPNRVAFLLDVPIALNGPKTFKAKSFILFGKPGIRPGEFQLLSSASILPWTPAADGQLRGIVREMLSPGAPPAIARIVEAFHVRGTVAGESESQIFLTTRKGEPVSLSIVRRPQMEPRFGAALGEIVDEAADLPAKDTLLWYRLACGLPASLPTSSIAKLEGPDAQAANTDYQAFMARLGPCERKRPPLLGNANTAR